MESLTLLFGQNKNSITIDEYGEKYDLIFSKKEERLAGKITQSQKDVAFKLLNLLKFAVDIKFSADDFERYRRSIVESSAEQAKSLISHMKQLLVESNV